MDYLVLVNQLHPVPPDWDDSLETEHFLNSAGEDVEMETRAFHAYLELKAELKQAGIEIDTDSACRTRAFQQQIMDDFTAEFGAGYAAKTVAPAGYSEHQTGLAADLYPIIDGQNVMSNAELLKHPELWTVIHARLAAHGFILRYPERKEHITGYGYEPWHVRFLNDPLIAEEIMSQGLTLEEYLQKRQEPEVICRPFCSRLFSEEELAEMAVLVKCTFASRLECTLRTVAYSGDQHVSTSFPGYSRTAEFLCESESAGRYVQETYLLGNSEYGWQIISHT